MCLRVCACMCVLYCTAHEAREGRGEEKPEGRQHCSHWWKFQLSLCSASLAHCFFFLSPFFPLNFLFLSLFLSSPYFLHSALIHSFPFNLSTPLSPSIPLSCMQTQYLLTFLSAFSIRYLPSPSLPSLACLASFPTDYIVIQGTYHRLCCSGSQS